MPNTPITAAEFARELVEKVNELMNTFRDYSINDQHVTTKIAYENMWCGLCMARIELRDLAAQHGVKLED